MQQYSDLIELLKVDADSDSNEPILEQYDVRSIPTFIMETPEGRVLGTVVGEQSETDLINFIEKCLVGADITS
jgi:thioredoxin-like negative regulator of GroEL